MGEQLRSPFIDSIASIARPKSIMTSSKLKNREQEYRQVMPIKDSINKILEEFESTLPSFKKIPHGIIDAVYYPLSETILALCYENYLLNYNPVTGAFNEKQLFTNITCLSECQNENLVIAIGTTDVLFINIFTLDIENQIPFNNITNCCPFSTTEIIVSTLNEVFIINTNTSEKIKADIETKNIRSISVGGGLVIISDEKGLFSYSKTFALNNSASVSSNRLLKFSASFATIIAINESEISLFNRELMQIRTIYISNPVLDAILDEKQQVLTFCDTEGYIWLCDLRTEKRKIKISAHSTQISKIFLWDQKIISLGTDCKISVTKFPKLHKLYVSSLNATALVIVDKYSTVAYITDQSEVKFWNFKSDISITKLKSFDLTPYIFVHEDNIYVSNSSFLFEIGKLSGESRKTEKKTEVKYFAMAVWSNFLVCAGESQLIYLWDLLALIQIAQIQGHENYITCLGSLNDYVFSGSYDTTVRVWSFVDFSLKHVLAGHTMKVNCVIGDNEKIISASEDRTIKIWYLKNGSLIYSINGLIGSIKTLIAFDEEYLVSCAYSGKITYWNLQTYTAISNNNVVSPVLSAAANEYVIIYTTGKAVYTMRNPLFYDKISATGPNELLKYEFIDYCSKLLKNNNPAYNPEMDNWIILPYFITPLHLYAYLNHPDYISFSLKNGVSLVQSRLDLNPLTIAVSRDLETCFESMLKPLKSQLNKNPFCLSFLTDKSLLEMNFTSHACLSRFYGLIFRKFSTQSLPKFLSYSLSLPVYSHSLNIIPTSKSFFEDKYIKDTGQPVLYKRSIVKLNLQFGSKESIALLQSVAECKNIEIFKTPFINAYINEKWEALKWFMWIQFAVYSVYLTLFCIYMLYYYEDKDFILYPFLVSILLAFYEVFKACVSKYEYFQNYWNYVDIARALLFFSYVFQKVAQGHKVTSHKQVRKVDRVDDMLLILTILSFLRGISYFRLFKSTRYFTQLVYQVILNSRAFSIVLFYSTVGMGFLLYIVFEFQYDFSDSLSFSFQINLDYLDPSEFNSTQWVVYSFGITVNYLMMMSLLVSIYADTFVKVMARAEIENCRALAVMSLEAERNMFWNRKKTKKEYLMLCDKDYLEEDEDPVLTRVKQVKASIKNIQNQLTAVVEIRKGIDKIIDLDRKIIKTLPKSLNKADKKNNAVLLLSLLVTVRKTENPQVRAMGLKKIFKMIKKLS